MSQDKPGTTEIETSRASSAPRQTSGIVLNNACFHPASMKARAARRDLDTWIRDAIDAAPAQLPDDYGYADDFQADFSQNLFRERFFASAHAFRQPECRYAVPRNFFRKIQPRKIADNRPETPESCARLSTNLHSNVYSHANPYRRTD